MPSTQWPYPFWIAHRGAGAGPRVNSVAPENTLAAFRVGAKAGYAMFECDVKLSLDEVPFLLHDDTLDRTANGKGLAGDLSWEKLSALDAGSWHSSEFRGERLPTLEDVARFCIDAGCHLNIEIKPTPGREERTGEVVALTAQRLWPGRENKPLLSSFSTEALESAMRHAPDLPRALLLEAWRDDWLEVAGELACVAAICHHTLWNDDAIAMAQGARLKTLSYTVNEEIDVQRLKALGIDGLITDRVDRFSPSS